VSDTTYFFNSGEHATAAQDFLFLLHSSFFGIGSAFGWDLVLAAFDTYGLRTLSRTYTTFAHTTFLVSYFNNNNTYQKRGCWLEFRLKITTIGKNPCGKHRRLPIK
jgi:hypothetical protein